MSKEMIVKQPTKEEIALAAQYEEFAGAGFEEQTTNDRALSLLKPVEANSKVKDSNPDAKDGMIYDTATGMAWDGTKGLVFVPSCTRNVFVERSTKDDGSKFLGEHALNSTIVKRAKEAATKSGAKFGKFFTDEGHQLVETFYVYGIAVDVEKSHVFRTCIPFSSKKIKGYRTWNNKASGQQMKCANGEYKVYPIMSHTYRLTTKAEKNDQGQKYHTFVMDFTGATAEESRISTKDPLFVTALALRDMVQKGEVTINQTEAGDDDSPSDGKAPF
jgi:hypothetical protein